MLGVDQQSYSMKLIRSPRPVIPGRVDLGLLRSTRARNPVITVLAIGGDDYWVPGSLAALGPGNDDAYDRILGPLQQIEIFLRWDHG